ncbi:glutamate 5-kinase [Sandaracinobacteroides sp. A072]|uniref:glutamate 5-kinase n=1 Tax=Sandaracinobacteroides sp. A072 TaxID=3461146 RepID=UPI0040410259
MSKAKRVVVKVGSSLLANPELLTPRWGFMQRLLEDIARLRKDGYQVILCSSGAVALGLNMIGATPEEAGLADKQAAAACGMPLLLNAYKQLAREYRYDIAQILVTLDDFEDRRRFLNTKNTVQRLLDAGIMPIVNENDTITTEEIRVGDNDRLAAKVAQMVGARELVILTSVDGLYDRDPSEEGARLVEVVEDVSEYLSVTAGTSTLGSGGMLTKMQAANMAQHAGCTTFIANGEADDPISSVLRGDRLCTRCLAFKDTASDWVVWLTNRLQVAGSIVVSSSVADGLGSDGRGVLRQDVVEVNGPYYRGDVLHIYDDSGKELARGLTDFSSEETGLLVRNPETSPRELLGYQTSGVLIKPANLILLDERHIAWDMPESTDR